MSTTTIPAELIELPQWVVWKHAERNGKPTKIPFQADGIEAKSNDSTTWTTFENAVDASNRYEGVGFMFSESDDFCGIDLDGCRDPETGVVAEWAANWINSFNSYTEVSPSRTGVKIFVRGRNPRGNGKNRKIDVPAVTELKEPGVEVYDKLRYFAVTGNILDDYTLTTCEARQEIINEFCDAYFPEYTPPPRTSATHVYSDVESRAAKYLATIPGAVSGSGGHNATYHAACVLVIGFNLSPENAFPILAEWNQKCSPPWEERELVRKLAEADKRTEQRGDKLHSHNGNGRDHTYTRPQSEDGSNDPPDEKTASKPQILTIGKLCAEFPQLRHPIIDGIIRKGDTANIIAPPKVGKSWCSYGIALSVATGLPWLGRFDCEPGRVLLIDNELFPSDIAWRIPKVASAMGIPEVDYCHNLDILPLRGQLMDLIAINRLLTTVKTGEYSLVIFDAFYRGLPSGMSENDNAAIAGLFNLIDQTTDHLQSAWINIHHSSKGSQSGKSVVDVGAGAGSQSRAADAHLVLREHQEAGFAVLDGAVRTFPPIQPVALKWDWPLWNVALDIDPSQLAGLLTRGDERQNAKDAEGCEIVLKSITDQGAATSRQLLSRGIGMGDDRCKRLLGQLERDKKLVSTPTIRRGMPCQMYHLPGDVSWCSGHVPEQGDT
jgi:hypothetical protein